MFGKRLDGLPKEPLKGRESEHKRILDAGDFTGSIMPPPEAVKLALPPTLNTSAALSVRLMPVPLMLDVVVTVTLAPAASVIAPAEVRLRLFAVLMPLSCVSESSAMLTAPPDVNVRLPKFIESPAWLPR